MQRVWHLTSDLRPQPLRHRTCFYVAAVFALCACTETKQAPPLFESLSPSVTGVTFENTLPEKADFNELNYLYYYDGGGVAAGDIDNDGLPDLYFTSNLGPNRLYRNKGNYQFEDVTGKAGVADSTGWKTGVTMADVNGDGHLDIYVSAVDYLTIHGHNVLYVNNGDGTFTDRTKEYGLDFAGYSTQALFFDYDGDGDLDMYLLNHSTHTERSVGSQTQREERNQRTGDRLYRNDGNHFVDVSEAAGVGEKGVDGYGLGVVASDLNGDGCPDLYIANDFQGDDFLYINNCNGTFTESIAKATGHTSRFSMGVDAADFNNDGRSDLVVLDMLPDSEAILKTSANAESFNIYNLRLEAGYHPQFARNTLQLNRGAGRFSDIGYLAGVAATDWSWAPLFADFDNDGLKDLFITNGIYRRPNDMDYITYVGNEAVQASLAQGITQRNLGLLKKMPQVPQPNYAYRNNGNLTFTNMAQAWGLAQPGFSNGAAYVDLNNSGQLDLVVNNINAPASIYRNHAREINGHHYLRVTLRGSGANTEGIGARVEIVQHGKRQMVEQMPTRGFLSSVDPVIRFGLGASKQIDSLTVIWPDHRSQTITDVVGDQTLTLSQKDAKQSHDAARRRQGEPLFSDVTSILGVDFKHEEDPFYDYNREPLMPHLLSTEGPALAVGDINGDGLDDFYVGGAKWQPGKLFFQKRDGTFQASNQPEIAADSLAEDVDAIFFDANGDRHQDLLVVSGGNEFWGNADALRPRLYLNDGKGNLRRAKDALADVFENGSCAVAGDFNGDGHPDLFLGSRVVSRSYGIIPRSHLLQNDGTGRFTDVTLEKAPALSQVGMVSSAAWLDYDGDGKLDLIVTGEWMPVRVFRQENGKFADRTAEAGMSGTNGWWNSITTADVNGDGRQDLVLGNLGLNSFIKASRDEPARLYVGDFFQSGAVKQILTFYNHDVSYPMEGRDELVRLMPALRSKYPSYSSFGASRIEDILPASELKQAKVLEAGVFASSVAINNGNGTFSLVPLPNEGQFAPVYSVLADDFDGDGRTDLLLGGNFYGVTPVQGRYDASYGQLLRGNGKGQFEPVDLEASGLAVEGQVRHIKSVRRANGETLIIMARNNEKLQILRGLNSRGPRVGQLRSTVQSSLTDRRP
jgi:enediyne biosynthesis protein E4